MRKFYYLAVVGLLFLACTVDNDEMNLNNDQIQTANSVLEVDGCITESWTLSNEIQTLGEVKITNDLENLYINFLANEGFSITGIKWEVTEDSDDLPQNNGGIIPGRLAHNKKFTSGTEYHGESISMNSFESDCVVLAARVSFKNSKNQAFHIWVENMGNEFLDYCICLPQNEPVCEVNAGGDVAETYTIREIDELVDSHQDLETHLKSLLDDEVSRDGTFEPSAEELVLQFYFSGEPRTGVYETTYTVINEVGGVECSDSAEFVITLVSG